MAEGKKSFLMYADYIHTIRKMPDDKAGILLKHILSYVNDENPVTDDIMVELVFEPIKQQMKRDLVSWEETKEKYSKAGRASAEKRRLAKEAMENGEKPASEKKERKKKESTVEAIDWDGLLIYINQAFKREFKVINKAVRTSFNARLKEGYAKADIIKCINNLVTIPYHKENGYQYCTPEFISRSDTLQKYSTKTTQPISSGKPSNVNEL